MFKVKPYFLVLLLSTLLAGCAATGGKPIYTLPAGSKVKLNQEITATGGRRIFIQGGQTMERRDVTVTNPYCLFSLDRANQDTSDAISIKPDTFTVNKAYRQRDYVLADGVQYAGRAGSDRTLSTVMEISSNNQPEVTQMICSRWGMISDDGWVTIAEMQTTLRELVEIVVAE